MYRETRPAWHRDVKWISGILAMTAVVVGTIFFSLAQLTERDRALPIIRDALADTLQGGDEAAPQVEVRSGVEVRPGEPFQLLPGVDVFVDPTEVDGFGATDARNRIAGVLADRTVRAGTEGARAVVEDPALARQLREAFDGTVPRLVRLQLERALLPAGLENGSRFANWPLQASQNPGEPVQPVVGVFVFVDPARLQGQSTRAIAELVIGRLAERVLGEGLDAAEEAVTNQTLRTIFVQTVESDVRAALHEYFATLLAPREEQLRGRLEQVQTALAGDDAPQPDELGGLLPAEELAGLSDAEAEQRVLDALATRAYEQGGGSLVAVLTNAEQADRVAVLAPMIDGLGRQAHARYVRGTWIAGIAGALFLALLIGFSAGMGRLVNPGLALALAAAGGALLFQRLSSGLTGPDGPAVVSVGTEGVAANLLGVLAYVGMNLPQDAVELLFRNHLVVLAVGGGLVVLSVLLRVVRWVRPRRRSLL